MHRFRRFAVGLLGLLLVQASAPGLIAACQMPAAITVVLARAATDGAVGNVEHDAAGHDGHGGATAEYPADIAPDGGQPPRHHGGGQQHCPASTSCATVAVVAVSLAVSDDVTRVGARIIAPRAVAPSSVVRGPEPPPPRA